MKKTNAQLQAEIEKLTKRVESLERQLRDIQPWIAPKRREILEPLPPWTEPEDRPWYPDHVPTYPMKPVDYPWRRPGVIYCTHREDSWEL